MRSVTELMDSLDMRATSPDGQIRAKYTSGRSIAFKFQNGSYERYDEETLATQLRELLRELFETRHRAVTSLQEEVLARNPAYCQVGLDPAEREFLAELERLVCIGKSPGEVVRVGCQGHAAETRVAIKQGTLARLDCARFLAEFKKAVAAMMADYQSKVAALTERLENVPVRNAE